MREVGTVVLVGFALFSLAGWSFAKRTLVDKIAHVIAFFIICIALLACATVAAVFSVARVQNGKLEFSFCGLRTRSFLIDQDTTFEISKRGRLKFLKIRRGKLCYVPSGALDTQEMIDLLREIGIAEHQKQDIVDEMHELLFDKMRRGTTALPESSDVPFSDSGPENEGDLKMR